MSTSEQIAKAEWGATKTDDDRAYAVCMMLKEIAYQFALFNEAVLPIIAEERARQERWKREAEEEQARRKR